VAKRGITPNEKEIQRNRRARSARLRVAEKLAA
jgi:16S rRNA C1402 N4-methylase RsmH